MTTTFNPSDKAATVVLSNGNLSITTTSSAGTSEYCRAVNSATSGKFYYELVIDATDGSGWSSAGVANASSTDPGDANAISYDWDDGNCYTGGSPTFLNLGTPSANSVFAIAFDVTAKKIWFKLLPSGNWNGSGAADPATGAGGVSWAFSGAVFANAAMQHTGNSATARFLASSWTGTAPSGFGEINAAVAAGPVFAPPAYRIQHLLTR
jgi:hypothetical protein